jgi:hypothetical protein
MLSDKQETAINRTVKDIVNNVAELVEKKKSRVHITKMVKQEIDLLITNHFDKQSGGGTRKGTRKRRNRN